MSHPARLSLRAPPHLPFIQGYPGIPGEKDRKQAAICGTVEVRVGAQPIKAKWVRVEIRKHESLPPGFPHAGETWELVGEIMTLWQAAGTQGKEFDNLQTADFKFFLPLPETMPPTVEMMKGTGVWYELVAALSYRKKGGIFKADSASIMKISEPIRITKHELHSAWPVYNKPDQKSVAGQDLTMTIARPGVAFGPGDRILLTASLKSTRPLPFKLRGFECTLLEIVTAVPEPTPKDAKRKSKTPSQPTVKSRPIAQARCAVDESVGRGGEKSARIDMAAPSDLLVTCRHAKTLEVGYELQVKAVCEGFEGPVVPGIKYVVGPFARGSAQQAIKDIGHVDQLCGPRISRPTSPSSGLSTPPNGYLTPSNQGFVADDPRRQSTSTITTTTTQDRLADLTPSPGHRPYSTVPNRQTLAFPTAHPAPGLQRSASTTISDYSVAQPDERINMSDLGHSNRFSTATSGTFGNWDQGLRASMQTPELKKNPWDSAEREKLSLYNTARQTAATNQSSAGIPLDRLGLADIPDVAPPEYAPPVPVLPGGKYQAPVRPVSAYTSPDASIASGEPSPEVGSPVSIVPPVLAPQAYSSAADEKAGQLERYESPMGLAAGGPGLSAAIDAGPSGMGSGGIEPQLRGVQGSAQAGPSASAGGNGLSEKEQMRRYYEAKDKVDSRGEGSNSAAGPSIPDNVVPVPAASMTGLSEKEQMRRYYEARDRADQVQHGGPSSSRMAESSPNRSGAPSSGLGSAAAAGGMSSPAAGSGAVSEKEQMRRYYEARDRAEQAQKGAATGHASTLGSPETVSAPAIPATSVGAGSAVGSSGLSEKEQMRRYYEARDRADQVQQGSPSGSRGMSPPTISGPSSILASASSTPMYAIAPFSPPPPPSDPTAASYAGPSNPPKPTAYESATDEKERMRRLYEDANERVSRAHGGSGSGGSAVNIPAKIISAPPSNPPPQFDFSGTSQVASGSSEIPPPPSIPSSPVPPLPPTLARSPLAGNSTSQTPFPSAEQEKEAMRRRYENASSAVTRARLASPTLPSTGYMQANEFPSFAAASTSTSEGPGSSGAPPPPPPLPSRPPADYINLLSPSSGPSSGGFSR